MKKLILFAFMSVLAGVVQFGCAGSAVDPNSPQDLYKDAEEDVEGKHYTIALDKLKALKNKFPYSHLATQAKLRIADVYFMEESFIESASAYESFRDMHPKHERADYVLFRIGESYFFQLPDSEDRDLSPATKAIDAYRELLSIYPKSQYVDLAKKHLVQATDSLAAKERYIADFYYKNEQYDSAAGRYEKITTKYAGAEIEQYAYWRLGQSLIRQNKLDEAKHVYRTYVSRYPDGTYAHAAGDWLDRTGGR